MTAHCVAMNHDGPFCDELDCTVCCLFRRPWEGRDEFKARLIAAYSHLGGQTSDGQGRPRALPATARQWP